MILTIRFIIIVILSIIFGSIYLAFTCYDPHWINRGGALLAAVAASLAIIEATLEHRITKNKASEKSSSQLKRNFPNFVSSTAVRIRNARFRVGQSALSSEKLKIVFITSLIAVVGEILHGFGDLFFKLIINMH